MTEASGPERDGMIGPVLYFRRKTDRLLDLTALLAVPAGSPPPRLAVGDRTAPRRMAATLAGRDIHLCDFSLTLGGTGTYAVADTAYAVDTRFDGDLRIAYAACNGQEHGDVDRQPGERNVMWARLAAEHEAAPFGLLLHGGDQIYADEATDRHPLTADWPRHLDPAPSPDALADLRRCLTEEFATRYLRLLAQPAFAFLAARVPSLAMWDDHDICDGWGSLKAEILDSPQGRELFAVARRLFLLFQMGATPDLVPAAVIDPSGTSLGWQVALPGLRIIAPDLRSERRPDRVMGPRGWAAYRSAIAQPARERTLILSSVPAIGPRLSLVEAWMQRTPWFEKYEDDLRDQWQSRAHRAEWQDFLRAALALHWRGSEVTFVSGEIHLATRGTLASATGPIHQLVASGIAHPAPPKGYARALGLLARFGETPLKAHPIRLHPLPGQRGIYTAERNYLVLARQAGAWTASWRLEQSGTTPPLAI